MLIRSEKRVRHNQLSDVSVTHRSFWASCGPLYRTYSHTNPRHRHQALRMQLPLSRTPHHHGDISFTTGQRKFEFGDNFNIKIRMLTKQNSKISVRTFNAKPSGAAIRLFPIPIDHAIQRSNQQLQSQPRLSPNIRSIDSLRWSIACPYCGVPVRRYQPRCCSWFK